MNILLINASPKGDKSNTFKLSKAFCDGICEQTSANLEILDLARLNIKDCRGCFVCWRDTPGVCCIKDDMGDCLEKIKTADIIVWSFPLYYFGLPSRVKAFLDRQLPLSLPFMNKNAHGGSHPHRYDDLHQKNVLISTCGFYTTENNYSAVTTQFDRIFGENNYTSIFCAQGELFRVEELRSLTEPYLEQVKKAGKEFISGGIKEDTVNILNAVLLPREIFEQMADASWGIELPTENPDSDIQSFNTPLAKDDESLVFTKQMACLYNKSSWDGSDKILELFYTDIDKHYQIILGKDGFKILNENFLNFTTKIETPFSVWQQISRGEISGEEALMEHKYRVDGDFTFMMNWDKYFGIGTTQNKNEKSGNDEHSKKSNMNLLLFPWIIAWTLISINPTVGGFISILACSILPFMYLKYKPVIFEYISIVMINLLSLLSVLGYDTTILVPLSYLLFGVLWFVTLFLRVPLTAYYSLNEFSVKNPLENKLFLRTNRIITGYFAVLYLLTPIWTYFLLTSSFGAFTGAVNSVLPAVFVAFTNKFKDFYPKYYMTKRV